MSVSISYSFSPTTTIESSQVNQNFTDLVNYINNTASVTGMVTMWAGAIGSIPTGWQLCNGSGDAPDMRDKFVMGAGNTYSIDDEGGASSISIAHTHTGPSHTHTGPSHTHTIPSQASLYEDGNKGSGHFERNDWGTNAHNHGGATGAGGTGTTGSGGTGNTGAMSANSSKSILPPFYALAYLYKT